jgi:hypothetical protein
MKAFLPFVFLAAMLAAGCSSSTSKPAPQPLSAVPLVPAPDDDVVHIYVDEVRADLAQGKIEIINNVMQLSDDEDKIFWPIYNDYEQEQFALGDRRLELMREFVIAQDNHTLGDAQAAALIDRYFQYEQDRLELLERYTGILSKALSPIRAAQFAQIEHRIDTVIDLMIASQMPLVEHNAPAAKVTETIPANPGSAGN